MLLDSGLQLNFISDELSNKLQLPRQKINCIITGVKNWRNTFNNGNRRIAVFAGSIKFKFSNVTENNYQIIKMSGRDLSEYIGLTDTSSACSSRIDLLLKYFTTLYGQIVIRNS